MKIKDHNSVFFSWDLENSIADNDFKVCSELKVKINDTIGEPKSYNFNMKGCNLAFNYMKGWVPPKGHPAERRNYSTENYYMLEKIYMYVRDNVNDFQNEKIRETTKTKYFFNELPS